MIKGEKGSKRLGDKKRGHRPIFLIAFFGPLAKSLQCIMIFKTGLKGPPAAKRFGLTKLPILKFACLSVFLYLNRKISGIN